MGGTVIRREGNRVWLELDEYYPPPNRYPNTVFKSLAIGFQAAGASTMYVDLMGISAAAFRLQVGAKLCPSSPHPHLGFSCAALAQESLGYELVAHEWNYDDPETVNRAKQAVVASVDSGRPALAEDEETGLAVGYVDGGSEILARDPYSNRGDTPTVLEAKWPGWGMSTIDKLPTTPTRETVLKSLQTAITLATTDELLGKGYACGFAAYDRWVEYLRDPSIGEAADIDVAALVLGNAHIYYCLIDARTCATEYLSTTAAQLFPEIGEQMIRTAQLYDSLARKLDAGWDNVPWPWRLQQASDWTLDQRLEQAGLLCAAQELERSAVAEMARGLQLLG